MKIPKALAFFLAGGSAYVLLEFLWRGRSHSSMFLTGGICFLLLGKLKNYAILTRAILGSVLITTAELIAGLLFNRRHQVWDYRSKRLNFKGQICPQYSLLWMPVSLGGIWLYEHFERLFPKK